MGKCRYLPEICRTAADRVHPDPGKVMMMQSCLIPEIVKERVDVSYESINGLQIYKLISRDNKRRYDISALERGRRGGRRCMRGPTILDRLVDQLAKDHDRMEDAR
jgi:hypothetical protein